VPRRVSLPGADELFRTTGGTSLTPAPRAPDSLQNREAAQEREARASREGQPADPAGEHGAAAVGDGSAEPEEGAQSAERPPQQAGPSAGQGSGQVPGQISGQISGQNSGQISGQFGAGHHSPGSHGGGTHSSAVRNGVARNGAATIAPMAVPLTAPMSAPGRSIAKPPAPPAPAEEPARRKPRGAGRSRPTGRERHEEKITVYVSAEELIDLEHARLVLRGEHGLAVDRGRIVREAVAVVLADLEQRGEASILVRRLRGR